MEPQHLGRQPVNADDHRGRDVGRLEVPAPLRDQLAVTSEHDCVGPTGREVHRNLATTVVAEGLGDELSRQWRTLLSDRPVLARRRQHSPELPLPVDGRDKTGCSTLRTDFSFAIT